MTVQDRPSLRHYRMVLPYLRPHSVAFAVVIGIGLLATLLGLAQPYLTKYLIDSALLTGNLRQLVYAVLLMLAATVAGFGLNIVSSYHYTRISAAVLFAMRLALYRHLQCLSPSFWARSRMGDVVSRLNNDIAEIQRVSADAILSVLSNVAFLVGAVAIMITLEPRLFLLSIALLPFGLWATRRYQNKLADHIGVMRQRSADIGTFLIETLMGVRVVTANAQEHAEAERFAARNRGFVDALLKMQLVSYVAGALPGTILAVSTASVFLYGGWLVIQGQFTLGGLVAFMAYHARLLAPFQNLLSLYGSLITGAVSLQRVRQLWDVPVDVQDSPGARALDRVEGVLTLDAVTFRHQQTPVLQQATMRIPARSLSVLIGASGSGKSTIADLLLRFQDPESGAVLLDGHDLRHLRLRDVRGHIALVEQTPFLFHASIAGNIAYARPEASRDEVRDAARAAALEPFLATLPDGLDTMIGERGLTLSAGERQRVALARALLRRPAVLVLDEPTSALDPATEAAVQQALAALRHLTTILVITHRESFLTLADHVFHLRDGRIHAASSTGVPA